MAAPDEVNDHKSAHGLQAQQSGRLSDGGHIGFADRPLGIARPAGPQIDIDSRQGSGGLNGDGRGARQGVLDRQGLVLGLIGHSPGLRPAHDLGFGSKGLQLAFQR